MLTQILAQANLTQSEARVLHKQAWLCCVLYVLHSTEHRAGPLADPSEPGPTCVHMWVCRYLNNPREALQHLNAARRHVQWSTPALLAMAEIYLNPDSDVNWATDSEADATPQQDGDSRESVQAVGTLLKQLKTSDMQSTKYKVSGQPP